MKKIICICLTSGCDKPLSHGRPVNAVAKDRGSEGVPTHSLTSDTSAPTSEPSKSAPPDTGSSVRKYVAIILSVIAVYGGYKLLYRFADVESASSRSKGKFRTRVKLSEVSDDGQYLRDGIRECFHEYVSFYSPKSYFFDKETKEYIDEIPFMVGDDIFYYYYIPTSSKLKSLKIWLRKILRIPTNYSALIKKI